MAYKTISIKLLKPGAEKRRMLDDAVRRYSEAYEALLRGVSEQLDDKEKYPAAKSYFLKLMDKSLMGTLDSFGVEPFKDALKLDAAILLSSYYGRISSGNRATFPVSQTVKDDFEPLVSDSSGLLSRREVDSLYDKYGNQRPVFFCRYAENRDYSLLVDEATGRFYAKLYLFNSKEALPGSEVPEKGTLRYLLPGNPYFSPRHGKRRYLLLPLEVGGWQKEHLIEAMKNPSVLRSAQLLSRKNNYFLNIRLLCEPVTPAPCETYLGIARGLESELYYSLCTLNGDSVGDGPIEASSIGGANRLHHLANRIVELAQSNRSKIILCNLVSRHDRLNMDGRQPLLSRGEYNSMCEMVKYKAEMCTLDEPVAVSPSNLFHRCPVCGSVRSKNRLGPDIFLCLACGYSQSIVKTASQNLARTLISYGESKIPVDVYEHDGSLRFLCRLLELSFACPADEYSVSKFYSYLRACVKNPSFGSGRKQQSIIKKIDASQDIASNFTLEFHQTH